jgi:hypothetical protein
MVQVFLWQFAKDLNGCSHGGQTLKGYSHTSSAGFQGLSTYR